MSIPITHTEIARAAIRFVKAKQASEAHGKAVQWHKLSNEDFYHEYNKANDFGDEVESARAELYGLVGRYEGQQ